MMCMTKISVVRVSVGRNTAAMLKIRVDKKSNSLEKVQKGAPSGVPRLSQGCLGQRPVIARAILPSCVKVFSRKSF